MLLSMSLFASPDLIDESIIFPRLITELAEVPLVGGPEGLPRGGGVLLSYGGPAGC